VHNSSQFSIKRLISDNPGLAHRFLWKVNRTPQQRGDLRLHLGCGNRIFDGFVNIDLHPQHPDVLPWDLTDIWPEEIENLVHGIFSEDCIEHFFSGEQTYILSNINRVLRPEATARILTPSLVWLVDNYLKNQGGLFATAVGIETSADSLNYYMRFTGHRWLHDANSLTRMATICGFEAVATDCKTSTVPSLSNLNLRNESNSASFAMDLRKVRHLSRVTLEPTGVTGASKVEEIGGIVWLYRADQARPLVMYRPKTPMMIDHITCINVRASNMTSFNWNNKIAYFNDRQWNVELDDDLASRPCDNIMTQSQLQAAARGAALIASMDFSPAGAPGDYFAIGPAEFFTATAIA
jgi:predicted SAM-dependent methyltransferase